MSAKIIAMVNQKGGVGKTTSTVNLGVGLAKQGHRVLLVDSDPQGSLTISMGIQDPDSLSHTLATAMLAEIHDMELSTESAIIPHEEGLDLLPANIELSGVEMSLFNAMSRETIMRNVLGQVKSKYDYILIDCMPSLGLMTINALAAADSVVIPSQPNYLSSKGLNLLLRSVAERSGLVKEGLDSIIEQDISARKEKTKDEHSRRRSGTDRQNVTERR